ncbi:MAG: hypothetical protein ABIG42_11870 [bacterium]
MAHAYTPGLRVTRSTVLQKERILPLKGNVIVNKGDILSSDVVVAQTELPGSVFVLKNVVNQLGCDPDEIYDYMTKKEGEKVQKGETIAENKPFLGLKFLKTKITSPVDGSIEKISEITGQILFREPPVPVQIVAYVDGKVIEIIPNEGVIMETSATFIQGIFGVGGETWGELMVVADKPTDILSADKITPEVKGKIIVGGSLMTYEAFEAAKKNGAKGIISGGLNDADLRKLLGYDIGVAITGSEKLGLSIVVTEGFGDIAMADKSFRLLKERNGHKASINGSTQIRAGVIRPEIVIPWDWDTEVSKETTDAERGGMSIGDPIRIIRAPFFGMIGEVTELPSELHVVESETKVRVLKVKFKDGKEFVVPRANVEIIED